MDSTQIIKSKEQLIKSYHEKMKMVIF